MPENSETIEAARALRPKLSEIIGDQANVLGPQLDRLLVYANQGQSVDNEIRSAIKPYSEAHTWFVKYRRRLAKTSSESAHRVYNPSAGDVQNIPAGKYICRHCDDSNPYFLFDEGGEVPDCKIHHIPRVLADSV